MQITSFVGKNVLSKTGERLGYVISPRLTRDHKKLSCLVCADEEEDEFFLPARAVLAAEDAVIAGRQRAEAPTGVPSPVCRAAYNAKGEWCGVVADVLTGDAPELVLAEEGKTRRIPVALACIRENVILFSSAEERRHSGASSRTKTGQRPPQKDTAPRTAAPPAAERAAPPAPVSPPQNGVPDRTNLLGRKVKRSVYDLRGNPVALEGERITPAILARARRENVLLTLTVNTLTNLY